MKHMGLPKKQGLYDPEFEHDACGIGVVANIKGKKSNKILRQGIKVLINLDHRGARGADPNTGDGAGILIQIPHSFFKSQCKLEGIVLPDEGKYAVGMIFVDHDEDNRKKVIEKLKKIILQEDQKLIGIRKVPVNVLTLGEYAKKSLPCIYQIFIEQGDGINSTQDFERKLYVIRKQAEKAVSSSEDEYLYFASLSSKTIVYKGMLTPQQLDKFYIDLNDESITTAFALVHSRFSTNTFPSWERAHPNRYIVHNGEINTLRGNVNWMHIREMVCKSDIFGEDIKKLIPVIDDSGSDSSMFDNCLEFLTLSGKSLPHAVMMMIPEPWENDNNMNEEKKAFYEYNSCLMEPWDGPSAIAFTDGEKVGAVLDRNGLRPARYYVTKDDTIVLASEAGVLDIPAKNIVCKERLHPGRMLLVDTARGRIVTDNELKHEICSKYPYSEWVKKYITHIKDLPFKGNGTEINGENINKLQHAFGYTHEQLNKVILPMCENGLEAIGAMGNDAPLAVLSNKPQLLYSYFKQLFAQVTNPPIDAIREKIVTGTMTVIGSEGNLLDTKAENCRRIKLDIPIITNEEIAKLSCINKEGFKSKTLAAIYKADGGSKELDKALQQLFAEADKAIDEGVNILILSDRDVNENTAPIPALLAVSALHHHLIANGKRTKVSLIVESGEPREVHHFALLIGYGGAAVNPYLVFDIIKDMINRKIINNIPYEKARDNYIKACVKGIVKVISKMGISTIQSYRGAQIFEAVGLDKSFIDKYFKWTPSRIGGIGLDGIEKEVKIRHDKAFKDMIDNTLDSGGIYSWRKDGEYHLYNPNTILKPQQACRSGDYKVYKEYSKLINTQTQQISTIRGLLKFKKDTQPIPIQEVEPVESIVKRFKTGAMSYGSISKEAHECLAIAMNCLKGKSNSGEGGEDSLRFIPDQNGDSRCSAIKQVASGRFGVTSQYLKSAKEIQIKIAQGAKPGEGGHLPGKKVYPWIAKVRNFTPGVGLISPPPHHDIYSIEDLAQLIFDLKNANPDALINVKLVSEVGVGTIAAGVAKGGADVILISGYDGGTGAAPRTSIRHAGLPWELGLAETQQTLLLNNLRSRVKIETDGKLMTGKDVVIAALLGAQEYGFATAPLVVMGCVMMRVCNLDTCPVGVATQNLKLRSRFAGKPEHVENFMKFIAREMREIMAQLGFYTVDEMVGRCDMLMPNESVNNWKTQKLDLSNLLYKPEVQNTQKYSASEQTEKTFDAHDLISSCNKKFKIKNTDRAVGTLLGSEVTKVCKDKELDIINLKFEGSAGQSFGAFIPKGITLTLEGDCNDYVVKGLSGGKIIIYPPKESLFIAENNVIAGNVAFYGATSGKAYICGLAGERFCVRNSGALAVVEGVGDHGCEYMTGGKVVILGSVGKNFAAGMSGGEVYVFDRNCDFENRCNKKMINIEKLKDKKEIDEVKNIIYSHYKYTDSANAKNILDNWDDMIDKFIKIIPKDYQKMKNAIQEAEKLGLNEFEAEMKAFEKVIGEGVR